MAFALAAPSTAAPSVAYALEAATARLRKAGVESDRLDAELLLATALRVSRSGLLARLPDPIPPAAICELEALVGRRIRREPLAYILGGREFWSLWFEVNAAALIPRPETERLVELALVRLREVPAPRVLDVGTGTGCIAIALARECPEATVAAVDVSETALQVARANALRHDVASRIGFVGGDIRTLQIAGSFDAIVSNPPYVRRDVLQSLAPEVNKWEPRLALDGGEDGLDVIRALLRRAPGLLRDGGWLLAEIGSDQADMVAALAERNDLTEVSVQSDYAGLPRVLCARRRRTSSGGEKET